jgi:TonB family protein
MKPAVIVFCLLLAGCTASRQYTAPPDNYEVVSMSMLPPLPPGSFYGGVTLDVLFHISNDGTVLDARMLKSSGDVGWDSSAIQSMKKWRFAVTGKDTAPGAQWIRHKVVVQIQEPMVMTLGELMSASLEEADSLYSLIQKGEDFDSLARRSQGETAVSYCRCPGAVEIARYPLHIREELKKLRVNGVTRPLRLGPKYVIFKRFVENVDLGVSE